MKETVSLGPRNTRGGYNGRRKRCGVKAAKAQIIGNYCSVIIAASFSGFIIQLLMVILGVAITGSRGVKFVRKNYPSYILPYKIHNQVI